MVRNKIYKIQKDLYKKRAKKENENNNNNKEENTIINRIRNKSNRISNNESNNKENNNNNKLTYNYIPIEIDDNLVSQKKPKEIFNNFSPNKLYNMRTLNIKK